MSNTPYPHSHIHSHDSHQSHSHHHSEIVPHVHDHVHEIMESPGSFIDRDKINPHRNYQERPFTIGIGGPVGSGKTHLLKALCELWRDQYSLGVVTNDIFTREDADFLLRHKVLSDDRIIGVETGGCPHAAIREDISLNLTALEDLTARFKNQLEFLFVESGGDNLAAHFSMELVDYSIYVIDVSGGDKIPRKGGPGITQSDLLVINKIDIAELVNSSLEIMDRDSKKMRGEGPHIFTSIKNGTGVKEVANYILQAKLQAVGS